MILLQMVFALFALGFIANSADAGDYNDRYAQQIGGTLHIHWELISGPPGQPIGCTTIEFTNGTLADAADGTVDMTGTGVSIGGCAGTDTYTFTMAPDGLSLSGFASAVPMTLTRLPEEASFVGDWVDSGYVYRAHIAADPFPVPNFNPQFQGEWIGWFERTPSLEMGTARLLINDSFFDGTQWSFDGLIEWDCLFDEECSATESITGTMTASGVVEIAGFGLIDPTNWVVGAYQGQLSDDHRTITGTLDGGTWSVTRVSAFTVPTEIASIQHAVDTFAERPGLRIEILPGTYTENVNLSALATNPGAIDITGLGNADQIIIDDGVDTLGNAIVQTLGAGSQYPFHLRNLTISGGFVEATSSDQSGAGLRINGGTRNLIIESCEIRNNRLVNRTSPYGSGAGAFVAEGSRVRFDSCSIRDNISVGGAPSGGLYFRGFGGGIATRYATVHVVSSSFTANEASAGGGMLNIGSVLRIIDSEFIGNNPGGSSQNGGGLSLALFSDADIIRSTFRDNQVRSSGPDTGTGGGIHGVDSNLRLVDVIFESNTAERGGGGLRVDSGHIHITGGRFGGPGGLGNIATNTDPFISTYGGAISNNAALSFFIEGTHFEGNSAGSNGGAIYFISPYTGRFMWIKSAKFKENQSDFGGAIFSSYYSGSITVIDSDFEENFATSYGGAFYQESTSGSGAIAVINNSRFFRNRTLGSAAAIGLNYVSSPFEIIGSTIVDNHAEGADTIGAGISVFAGTLDLSNSILWGNTGTTGSVEDQQIAKSTVATIIAQNGIVEGVDPLTTPLGPGIISGDDPLFVDVANGNLRLLSGSPAIDAGDILYIPEYQTTDLDGNPRINGPEVDLGPYENPDPDVIFKDGFQ